MGRKVSPADRFRKALMEAVGEASLDFSGYCRLAAQAMLQTAMEVEATEFIGRLSYERRSPDQSTYRNGFKRRKVTTGEGPVELFVPQTREGVEPFQTAILSAFQRRSEVLEAMIPQLYVKGLSVRDISDTFRSMRSRGFAMCRRISKRHRSRACCRMSGASAGGQEDQGGDDRGGDDQVTGCERDNARRDVGE